MSMRRNAFAMLASTPTSEKDASNCSFLWNSTLRLSRNSSTFQAWSSNLEWPGKSADDPLVMVSV